MKRCIMYIIIPNPSEWYELNNLFRALNAVKRT